MTELVLQNLQRDVQTIFHCFETQNSLTHLGEVNELTQKEWNDLLQNTYETRVHTNS